jgi:hypothetical protein
MSRKGNGCDNSSMERFFQTRWSASTRSGTQTVHKLGWISSTGSKASTVASVCILPSDTMHLFNWKSALWLRSLVYVKSRQGQWCAAMVLPWRVHGTQTRRGNRVSNSTAFIIAIDMRHVVSVRMKGMVRALGLAFFRQILK